MIIPPKHSHHVVDSLERETIAYHGGWAIKGSRETIQSGKEVSIRKSASNQTVINVSKSNLISVIESLGHDVLKEPGKHLFEVTDPVTDFFIFLNQLSRPIFEKHLKMNDGGKAAIATLKDLSVNQELLNEWFKTKKR